MKKSVIPLLVVNYLLGLLCAVASIGVSAHGGHDHYPWTPEIYHLLGVISIVVCLSALSYCFVKFRQLKNSQLRDSKLREVK